MAWYLALGCTLIGYDLEAVLQMNVDKLRKRYPNGFDSERSLHHEDEECESCKIRPASEG